MPSYLNNEDFRDFLSQTDLPRLDKLLVLLFWDNEKAKSLSEIKELASSNGLREIQKWNVSDSLGKSIGKAILIKGKWSLTSKGRNHLIKKGFIVENKSQLKKDVNDLRLRLNTVKDSNTKTFIEEAIKCLEFDLKGAAVVYSWIGAVSLLYDHIVLNHLSTFNAEALKRDSKWKGAKNADDLSKLKEYDFLNILEAISIIGKNVKQELQQCLQLRNSCGHPNSLNIGERKVAAHIEILILNVYSKF